jgi:hypothetical protein
MGDIRTSVTSGITCQETDSTSQLDQTRDSEWYPLSTEEWLQLGRPTERLAPLLNGVLALQTVACCRGLGHVDDSPS